MQQLLFRWTGYNRVQKLLESDPQQDGLAFISRALKEFGVEYQLQGTLASDIRSTVFVCTHHVGAIDFMTVYPALKQSCPQLKIVANNQLLRLRPLQGDLIAVHPISAKMSNAEAKKQIVDHLETGGSILVYPAGKVARKKKGVINDLEWRSGIFPIIQQHSKQVIPIFVNAENGNFFYFIRSLLPKLSMLFILRALTSRKNEIVKVIIGEPIESQTLQNFSASEGMTFLRSKTYQLKERFGDEKCKQLI